MDENRKKQNFNIQFNVYLLRAKSLAETHEDALNHENDPEFEEISGAVWLRLLLWRHLLSSSVLWLLG